jgi:hypothetical protein
VVTLVILDNDSDFGLGDSKSPKSLAVSLDESSQCLLNIVESDIETVDAVDHDVIAVGLSVLRADNLECVENITNEPVGLGNQVLGLLHVADESSRTEKSSDKESSVGSDFSTYGLVDVNLPVGRRERSNLEVGQTSKLELVGQSRLNVSDSLFFPPCTVGRLAEGEVRWVLVLSTDQEGDSSDALVNNLGAVLIDERLEMLVQLVVGFRLVTVQSQSDVHDVGVLSVGSESVLVLLDVKDGVHLQQSVKVTL